MLKPFDDFFDRKRIMLTGHTGFKGAWLSLWLKHLGAEVTGYALNPPTEPSLFASCGLDRFMNSVYGDVRDFKHLQSIINKTQPEIVIHLAAQSLVRHSYLNPITTYATNIMGTVHLLEAVRQTPSVKAVIIVSSDKAYENKEWCWGYRENDSTGGDDPYSSSKGCCELITSSYRHSYYNPELYSDHGVALASVRAGNVLGGGDWAQDRLVPDCIKALHNKKNIVLRYPNAVRPWQHVLEPLYGYLLLSRQLYHDGVLFSGAWNFGPDTDDARPVKQVVSFLMDSWGENSTWITDKQIHPHEANYLKLDCTKAKTMLGWKPKWTLEEALVKTVVWYKAYYNQEDLLKITLEQISSYEQHLQ